jgi:transcriptional regulator with XRE-family HTH domain
MAVAALPNLAAEMRRAGITQEQLAERIGRRTSTISSWMTGKTQPTVEDAFAIKDTCFPESSVDYLFSIR